MPLLSCPDCGREVSTRARQCVHCGRPWPACTSCPIAKFMLGLLIAAAVVMVPLTVIRAKHCCEARQRAAQMQMEKTRAVTPRVDKCEKCEPDAPKEQAPMKTEK